MTRLKIPNQVILPRFQLCTLFSKSPDTTSQSLLGQMTSKLAAQEHREYSETTTTTTTTTNNNNI
jgi:hypothetical protein